MELSLTRKQLNECKVYLDPLIREIRASGNTDRAAWSMKYLKNQFTCLGIEAKIFRGIIKDFFKNNVSPAETGIDTCALYLWNLPEREFQYAAIEILMKFKKLLKKEDIQLLEYMITSKSWWDTVDGIAAWLCGTYFNKYPEQIKSVTNSWVKSDNMWLQRSALLFQLKYKKETNTDLLARYIELLIDSKEFFIRKAIGWVLREYSKTDPSWVAGFVENHELSGLSRREATKYI
ncbi:MAG: DNA alkylation repair protein [Bacteroidales bacterium]|nr:DNA alkylation repair protein [Bacteroidales bacterium]